MAAAEELLHRQALVSSISSRRGSRAPCLAESGPPALGGIISLTGSLQSRLVNLGSQFFLAAFDLMTALTQSFCISCLFLELVYTVIA